MTRLCDNDVAAVTTPPSSAGVCSTCGKHVEKRYGGEGRYLPECADCWTVTTPPGYSTAGRPAEIAAGAVAAADNNGSLLEARYLREEKLAILSTAVGIARLRLRTGDVQGASDALDEAVDRCHREHWDACLADGHDPEKIEMLLGPRDEKVERVSF